ncbi:MAG: methionyl-tRNA formyltransferase [Spirochaetota bacterium]
MIKIIFAGTPELACPSLDLLHRSESICISAVLTRPDQPFGRRRVLSPSPVKKRALEWGLHIFTPEQLNRDVREQIAELKPDLLVVFAYGKIFRPAFLDLFSLGGINLHPSALPQWRGPSPIEAQLLAGSEQLGLSVQRISLEMDAGDILEQEFHTLPEGANYFAAAELAARQGAALLQRSGAKIAAQGHGYLDTARPQEHERASYCSMICKEDGLLDWGQSALQISRQCRAYAAWPRTYTGLDFQLDGSRIFQVNIIDGEVWPYPEGEGWSGAKPGTLLGLHPDAGLLVKTGEGILAVRHLQRQGKNICRAAEFANQLLPQYLPRLPREKLASVFEANRYCFEKPGRQPVQPSTSLR